MAKARRQKILELLENSKEIINASTMAEKFGVTRQIIVSDIALLRANGHKIISEKRGYFLEREANYGVKKVIICKHDGNEVLDEFYTVVDNGGRFLNVIVEHPIYGQITAELNIASRYDGEEFVKSVKESNASQLSDLTNGIHYHTILCPDEDAFDRIIKGLKEKGILQE